MRRVVACAVVLAALGGCGGKTLVEKSGEKLGRAKTPADAAKALAPLRSGTKLEAALADSFCVGVTIVGKTGHLPAGQSWPGYLDGQVFRKLRVASESEVRAKATELSTSANLPQITPELARRDSQGCTGK